MGIKRFTSIFFLIASLLLIQASITYGQTAVELYKEAENNFQKGKYTDTIALAQKIKQALGKTNPKIEALLMQAYFQDGDIPQAKIAFAKLLRLTPDNVKRSSAFNHFHTLGEQIYHAFEKAEREHKQNVEQRRMREADRIIHRWDAEEEARTRELRAQAKGPKYFFEKAKQLNSIEAYEEFAANFRDVAKTNEIIGLIRQAKKAALHFDKTQWGEPLVDSRDGQTYKTVKIGEQVWMAENLRYKTSTRNMLSRSFVYNDDYSNLSQYGRFYSHYAAKFACPEGWHLPSVEEWKELFYTVGADFNADLNIGPNRYVYGVADHLKAKEGWVTNRSNKSNHYDNYSFSIRPAGNLYLYPPSWEGDVYTKSYSEIGETATFWTSTLDNGSTGDPYRMEFEAGRGFIYMSRSPDRNMFSVRCVEDKVTHIDLGDTRYKAGDYDGAIAHYERAITENPDDWNGYYKKAMSLYYLKKYEAAIEMYDEAISRHSSSYYVYSNRGLAKRLHGDYEEAITDFKRSIILRSDNYFAHIQSGYAYYSGLKDYINALKSFSRALQYVPGEMGSDDRRKKVLHLNSYISSSYRELEDWDGVVDTYEKRLEIIPNDANTLNSFAYNLSLANRDLDRAEKMIIRALDMEKENPYFLDTAGWVYFKKGEYDKAKTYLQLAIDKGSPTAEVLEHMAAISEKLQQDAEAAKWWTQACKKGSDLGCKKTEKHKRAVLKNRNLPYRHLPATAREAFQLQSPSPF